MFRSTPRRNLLVTLAAAALVLGACGDDSGAGSAETATPTEGEPTTSTSAQSTTTELAEITLPPQPPSDYAGFAAQPTACSAAAPAAVTPMVFDAPEDQGLDPAMKVTAVISTSCGDISIELDPAIAPETVNSFVFLSRAGYFDGTVSHRVLPEFVAQAGDPSATGREGPGYTIPDELPEAGFLYERGVVAMANSGPNTSGSQFFIMLADAPLPPAYSVFGKVIDGFETLDAIETIPLGPNPFGEVSVPLETLYINSVAISP